MDISRTIGTTLVATLAAIVIASPALAGAGDSSDVAWAFGRFGQAGLELPNVEIEMHEDAEACGGDFGRHARTDGSSHIDLCLGPTANLRRVLLHELGHAWVAANLTEAERSAFIELRGLEAWNGTAPWNEKGTEQAAEVIAWALDEDSHLPGRFADHDVDSVTAAFRFLTGTDPLCEHEGSQTDDLPTSGENRVGGPSA
jgi:hypothetical protein